ncbi:TIGR04282 family arsenosugar biosynthesis glycosyltransferase [Alcanivorax sp. 24]|uniref:TIGR04282 family arsenosugar biosynthesis glycosyltransferase n=1 Tax=Alcanivorax sp. 24 TaxID=2545266 RepID=UPI001414D71C|nr:TIGR04282 family arsenosugar biosynthesis glycosyltransferase [Alcanivorax sp. 24]
MTRDEQTATLLLVFAKAPEPGRVKTRLAAVLGADTALAAHQALLERTLCLAAAFPGPAVLMLDRAETATENRARALGLDIDYQQGVDLGERMERAMAWGLARAKQVLLVGSDCPAMSREYLLAAADALRQAPVVLGPSEDGGFVLLGGSEAALWRQSLFRHVAMSTDHTLADTLKALSDRCRPRLLPTLWDVDYPEDLDRARRLGLLS